MAYLFTVTLPVFVLQTFNSRELWVEFSFCWRQKTQETFNLGPAWVTLQRSSETDREAKGQGHEMPLSLLPLSHYSSP